MTQPINQTEQKTGEVEQSTRSLINSALAYLSDANNPESLANARKCLEAAKYVLEGLYIPTSAAESITSLAHADETRWPNGVYESWGWINNTTPAPTTPKK